MNKWALVLLLLFSCPFIFHAKAQNISNEGTEFWAVFPSHDPSQIDRNSPPQLANIRIWVTSKTGSNVTVRCRGYSETKIIPANTPVAFNINPREQAYIEHAESNTLLSNRAIHIKVNGGAGKVAVYAHIFAGYRSAASLILPIESLGQKYYSMNYKQDDAGGQIAQNYLALVAIQDNTVLLIKEKSGNILRVELLRAGDVYQYMPGNLQDLTGVSVMVDPASPDNCDKRFAAFSGATSLPIGCDNSRDPLFQQLYPTISWGTQYGIVPFIDRRHIIRILALEDNTSVRFNGQRITLDAGQFHESGLLSAAGFVSADKKISVAQYALSQECAGANGNEKTGDPEMVMLNPIEFNIRAVTLFSSSDQDIREKYINVCMKTSATGSFRIDGQPVNRPWNPIPGNPEYSFVQLPITDASSYLTANDGFNAMAYGFGRTESYAYSAGTNLAANNYLLVNNKQTNNDAQNACLGQASDFKIVLPFVAKKITWQLDGGLIEPGSLNYKEIIGSTGVVSYEYLYPKNIIYSVIAQHTMRVVAEMPNENNCLGGDIEYNFTFDVHPIPITAFSADTEACPDTEIPFTDMSNSQIPDKPVNKWLWKFDDGTESTDQNPRHVFSTSGTFQVRLFSGLEEGCMNETMHEIIIRQKITPKFDYPLSSCVNAEVSFKDESTTEAGVKIIKRVWDFGDGSPISEDINPKHSYLRPGTFDVKLYVETENGCKSLTKTERVTIYALPQPDFAVPKVCVEDDMAEFIDLSANSTDAGTSALTYRWDFGDPASGTRNSSTEKNGKHKYNIPNTYIVKLTITNANGCVNEIQKTLLINGNQIQPKFEVLNETQLCSNKEVMVKNLATVNEGVITKIVWYPDADDLSYAVIDDDPVYGKEYAFLYPALTTADTREITIRQIVYTGIKCAEEITYKIYLKPTPVVTFSSISSVCINAGPVTIAEARETLNVQGTYAFSGPGITREGVFDPLAAGLGTHTLTYTFDSGGCEATVTQNITVTPMPVITAPADLYILNGGQKRIEITASGKDLRYKWSPATGLDRDDVLNPLIIGDADRLYTLTATSSDGCSAISRINLHVIPAIEVSNAFSPNDDGVNDTWNIKYIETYPNVTIEIFNRYGQRVFYSKGYEKPFDGNYQNSPLSIGTYYYIINPNNNQKIITGSLTLLR